VTSGRERALPWLLPLIALLPDIGAALPRLAYFFRDFTVTFLPLRLFGARELAEGRLPLWNPYVHEGEPALPAFYPPDLLIALWPSPEFVSWLLTIHLPLAALAAYALARDLGQQRSGAFLSGAVYALGGLAVSSLNLYVFLQALALAPLVALTLRRAVSRAARGTALAGLAIAVSLTTLAVEFVAQAIVAGCALAWACRPRPLQAVSRIVPAVLLGAGIAALPIALILGLLPETLRGAGLDSETRLGNALHPVALVQALAPGVFGSLSAPAETWWGSRFFTKGFPYFISIYVGPLALALAVIGVKGLDRRTTAALLVPAGAGLWLALGPWGGLAPLLLGLPGLDGLRFPSKALLLPFLATCLLAGRGLDRLRAGQGWGALVAATSALAALLLGLSGLALAWPAGLVALMGAGIEPAALALRVSAELARSALLATAGLGLAWAVRRSAMPGGRAALLLAVAVVVDLAAAHAGLNPQVSPAFHAPAPGLASERLDRLDGQRLFSFETERSPAVQRFLASRPLAPVTSAFLLHRRLLAPYTNVGDRVETALGKDLTSFALSRPVELGPDDFDPARLPAILPHLRNAGVARVLTVDPLEAPGVSLRASVPSGLPGLALRLYAVDGAAARATVVCRAVVAATPAEALRSALRAASAGEAVVVLEAPSSAGCTGGSARRSTDRATEQVYGVELDGAGLLLMRDAWARGWRATVDERPVPVLRANGKHRAVALPGAGRHRVRLVYEAPGLRAGALTSLLSLVLTCALLARGGRRHA
jgi:hypothetical protein